MRFRTAFLFVFLIIISLFPQMSHSLIGADNVLYLPIVVSPRPFTVTPTSATFSNTTAVTHAGDERLFVAELAGVIRVLQANGSASTFLDIRDRVDASGSELGLFNVAFHPDYAQNGLFYVSYTAVFTDDRWKLTLSQFQVSPDKNVANPASEQILLTIVQDFDKHNGGALAFNPVDGRLYMGVGDDSQNLVAQQPNSHKGRLLRITLNTSMRPASVGSLQQLTPDVAVNTAVSVERWAHGLRNPWRIAVDPVSGNIFVGDVGDRDWEEINFIPNGVGGLNFGWPCMEGPDVEQGGDLCNKNFELPIHYYAEGCSIVVGELYRPLQNPAANATLIFTDGCLREIKGLTRTEQGWEAVTLGQIPASPPGFLTTFGKSSRGEIYAGLLENAAPFYQLYIPPPWDR